MSARWFIGFLFECDADQLRTLRRHDEVLLTVAEPLGIPRRAQRGSTRMVPIIPPSSCSSRWQ